MSKWWRANVLPCLAFCFVVLSLLFCSTVAWHNSSSPTARARSSSGVSVVFEPETGILKLINPHILIAIDVHRGTLSYEAHGLRLIDKGQVGVSVEGTTYRSLDFSWATWNTTEIKDQLGTGICATVESQPRDGLKMTLAITLYEDSRYAILELGVSNVGQRATTVHSLTPLSVAPGGAFLRGISPRSSVVFINGYTNVGYRGVVPIWPLPKLSVPATLEDGTGNLQVGDYSGWWVHVVWNGKRRIAFVSGALTAEKWKTFIQLKPDFLRNRFVHWQVDNLGSAVLPAGESFHSEKIFLGCYTDPLFGLEEYAYSVREANGIRLREKVAGWCSWPYYYRKITASDILRNAQFIKEKLGSRYPYILIDSGWFTCRGDWAANEKFPGGMEEVARRIHQLGLKAGLWFAPFLVDKESTLLQEHPDWFVRQEDGSLYVYKQDMGSPDRYVLDGSHPAVQEWLAQLFAKVVKEWGYEYLKLDFLHAGAVEGKRYNQSMTGLQALREGLRAIRRGAGDEAYIQQAIGPFMAPIGILDESRVGMDTEFRLSATSTTSEIPGLNWQYALWYMRNNLAGYFAQGNLFNIAPGEGMRLHPWSHEEAKTFIAFYALSGSIWLAGDLTTLSEEKVLLLTQDDVLALGKLHQAARPVDLFARPDRWAGIGSIDLFQYSQRLTLRDLPRIWHTSEGGKHYVGLFNWREHRSKITLRFSDIGLDPYAAYSVTDLWSGEKLGEYRGEITLVLDKHAHRLLRIEKVP